MSLLLESVSDNDGLRISSNISRNTIKNIISNIIWCLVLTRQLVAVTDNVTDEKHLMWRDEHRQESLGMSQCRQQTKIYLTDQHTQEWCTDQHRQERLADQHTQKWFSDQHRQEWLADQHTQVWFSDQHRQEWLADQHTRMILTDWLSMNVPSDTANHPTLLCCHSVNTQTSINYFCSEENSYHTQAVLQHRQFPTGC